MTTFAVHRLAISILRENRDDPPLRLARTRWPDELSGVGWSQVASFPCVQEFATYWRHV